MFKSIIKRSVNFLHRILNEQSESQKAFFCPVCRNKVGHFLPMPYQLLDELDKHGYVHSIFCSETCNIFRYKCPVCGTNDRDRLYASFLEDEISKTKSKLKLLDIAPSITLRNFIKTLNVEYRSADLQMENVDDKVDITNMSIYEDKRFDLFICSHVLEHVKDDLAAIKELYRILKSGGWGIVMVPILLSISEDIEDDRIIESSERWKYYGQDDHVRMYSKQGFVHKLQSVGFTVEQFGVEHFGKEKFDEWGIHFRSVLYVVRK